MGCKKGCGSSTANLELIVKDLIRGMIDDGRLQEGLVDCTGQRLFRGYSVITCDLLRDAICEMIDSGDVCITTPDGLAIDEDGHVVLTLTDGTRLSTNSVVPDTKLETVTLSGTVLNFTLSDGKKLTPVDLSQVLSSIDLTVTTDDAGNVTLTKQGQDPVVIPAAPVFGDSIQPVNGKLEVAHDDTLVKKADGRVGVNLDALPQPPAQPKFGKTITEQAGKYDVAHDDTLVRTSAGKLGVNPTVIPTLPTFGKSITEQNGKYEVAHDNTLKKDANGVVGVNLDALPQPPELPELPTFGTTIAKDGNDYDVAFNDTLVKDNTGKLGVNPTVIPELPKFGKSITEQNGKYEVAHDNTLKKDANGVVGVNLAALPTPPAAPKFGKTITEQAGKYDVAHDDTLYRLPDGRLSVRDKKCVEVNNLDVVQGTGLGKLGFTCFYKAIETRGGGTVVVGMPANPISTEPTQPAISTRAELAEEFVQFDRDNWYTADVSGWQVASGTEVSQVFIVDGVAWTRTHRAGMSQDGSIPTGPGATGWGVWKRLSNVPTPPNNGFDVNTVPSTNYKDGTTVLVKQDNVVKEIPLTDNIFSRPDATNCEYIAGLETTEWRAGLFMLVNDNGVCKKMKVPYTAPPPKIATTENWVRPFNNDTSDFSESQSFSIDNANASVGSTVDVVFKVKSNSTTPAQFTFKLASEAINSRWGESSGAFLKLKSFSTTGFDLKGATLASNASDGTAGKHITIRNMPASETIMFKATLEFTNKPVSRKGNVWLNLSHVGGGVTMPPEYDQSHVQGEYHGASVTLTPFYYAEEYKNQFSGAAVSGTASEIREKFKNISNFVVQTGSIAVNYVEKDADSKVELKENVLSSTGAKTYPVEIQFPDNSVIRLTANINVTSL